MLHFAHNTYNMTESLVASSNYIGIDRCGAGEKDGWL